MKGKVKEIMDPIRKEFTQTLETLGHEDRIPDGLWSALETYLGLTVQAWERESQRDFNDLDPSVKSVIFRGHGNGFVNGIMVAATIAQGKKKRKKGPVKAIAPHEVAEARHKYREKQLGKVTWLKRNFIRKINRSIEKHGPEKVVELEHSWEEENLVDTEKARFEAAVKSTVAEFKEMGWNVAAAVVERNGASFERGRESEGFWTAWESHAKFNLFGEASA